MAISIKIESIQSVKFSVTVRPPRLGGNQNRGFASREVCIDRQILDYQWSNFPYWKHWGGLEAAYIRRWYDRWHAGRDIKPYLTYGDSIDDAIAGYANQNPSSSRLHWHPDLLQDLSNIAVKSQLEANRLANHRQLIAQDPRPAYRPTSNTPICHALSKCRCSF